MQLDLSNAEVLALAVYLRQKQANGVQHPPIYTTRGPIVAAMKRAIEKVDLAARSIQEEQDHEW
jgi:hypothetical protein